MPEQGKKTKLTETATRRYHDFYFLAIELFGKKEADKLIRWLSTRGRQARGRIEELTAKRLLEKVAEQEVALKSPKDQGYESRLEHAVQSTCHIADQLKHLARIWKQIVDNAPSRSKAGEQVQDALGNDYPWLSRTEMLQSGY